MSGLKKFIVVGAFFLVITFGLNPAGFIKGTTIVDGDLVKTAGSSAVYLIQGTTKRVMPHANVYASWGYPADYSTVKTVSTSDLAAYADGNAVPFRDGSLFRGTAISLGGKDKTAVFYVEGSTLKPVLSEAVYMALFKDPNWVKVTWVPDDLLTKFNYPMGTDLSSTTTHPNGVLIKYSTDSSRTYLIEGGKKRLFSSTAVITANRYSVSSVISVDANEAYADGDPIIGVETALLTVGWAGVATPVTGGLTISLDSSNPIGATLPPTAANVELLKVRLTAGSTAVNVTGMTFKRNGMGATGDWTSLAVYDGGTRLVSTGRTISSDNHEIEFPVLAVSIPANSSKVVTLRGTVSNPAVTGGRHYFSVKSVATTATVTGLPINGNEFVIGVTGGSTVTVAAASAPSNPNIGAQAAEIANFKLTAGTNDVEVKEVVLTLSGSLARASVTNLKLYQEATLLASAASVASNDTLTFTLGTPFTILKGANRIFTVKADVGGRVAETLTTKIDDVDHVTAVDKVSLYGAAITGPSVTLATVTMQGGTVTLADNGPSAGNITKNSQDVVLTKFSITSARQVEVKKLRVALVTDGTNLLDIDGTGNTHLDTDTILDLRIKDLDTGATVASKSLTRASCVAAAICLTENDATDAAGNNTWELTDSFYLTPNVTRHLAVTIDTGTETHLAGEYLRADVKSVVHTVATDYEYRDVATGDYIKLADVIPVSISGDNQTIRASALTMSLASTPVSSTVVKGAAGVDALGVVFTAGDSSAIRLTSLQARVYVSTVAAPRADGATAGTEVTTPNANILSAKLYDGDTLLSTKTLANTSGNATIAHDYGKVTFDGLNVIVPISSNKKLTIKLDTNQTQSAEIFVAVSILGDEAVDATADGNITAYDADSNTVDVTSNVNILGAGAPSIYIDVKAVGTLNMAADAETPVSDIILSGATGVIVSKIKFTATNETWTVNKLRIKLNTAAAEGSINKVTISPEGGTATDGYLTTVSAVSYVQFTNLAWVIPAGTSKVLTIKADLKAIDQNYAETGREIKLGVIDGNATTGQFEAVGTSQTTLTEADSTGDKYGNAMYLRKSKPTVTKVALDADARILADGTMALFKFNVAADAAGSITLKKVAFDVIPSDNAVVVALSATTWALYDSVDMNTAIAGTWSDGTTTSTAGAIAVTTGKTVSLEMTNEKEIAAGSSKTFVLKAVISNSAQYDSFITRLGSTNDTAANFVTGGLVDDNTELVKLDTGATTKSVSFLWSDKARGVYHAYGDGTYGSDYLDWTSGYLVKTLPTDYSSLSR